MSSQQSGLETTERNDQSTGVKVRQLTGYLAHSWHMYFTYSGWWRNNRHLLFNSHRGNRRGTYSIDLDSYEITLIADGIADGFFNEKRLELYGSLAGEIVGVDVETGKQRTVYAGAPDGFSIGAYAGTADGRYLCVVLCEKNRVDTSRLGQGYVGFAEYFESKPLCRILRVSLETGNIEQVHEERSWIGHVNPSPTRGNMLTFCHEGPWRSVEQRIWGLDIDSGNVWKIRPQENKDDAIGHEFWMADGEHVGYQGWMPQGPVYGFIRYDNREMKEQHFPVSSQHFYSNSPELLVGDGSRSPWLLLWQFDGNAYGEPRVLCKHRSSSHVQVAHVHPRFSPDNEYVLFTSDDSGYANLYQAYIPDIDSLPKLGDL